MLKKKLEKVYDILQLIVEQRKKTKVITVMGDMNGYEKVMVNNGLGQMNDKGVGTSKSQLIYGGSLFPHKAVHNVGIVEPIE